jgi:hypothetical protein
MFVDICLRLTQSGDDVPQGVYSSKIYKVGDVVRTLCGELNNYPTQKSIHIGNNVHVTDEYGQYINHSFDPNVRVVSNNLVAIKNININDEITFNYNDSEIEMHSPFMDNGIEVCGKKVNYKIL